MEFETPTKDGAELAHGQHEANAAGWAGAWILIGLGYLLEPIQELQFENDWELKGETQQTASVLEFLAARAMMQAKMTNADKASREDV